jgi:hypothetical protein
MINTNTNISNNDSMINTNTQIMVNTNTQTKIKSQRSSQTIATSEPFILNDLAMMLLRRANINRTNSMFKKTVRLFYTPNGDITKAGYFYVKISKTWQLIPMNSQIHSTITDSTIIITKLESITGLSLQHLSRLGDCVSTLSLKELMRIIENHITYKTDHTSGLNKLTFKIKTYRAWRR